MTNMISCEKGNRFGRAKDSEIEEKFRVDKDTFNQAEYSKAFLGGFTERINEN